MFNYPKQEYAVTFWYPYLKLHRTAQKGSKECNNTLTVLELNGMSYKERRETFKMPTLEERLIIGDIIAT